MKYLLYGLIGLLCCNACSKDNVEDSYTPIPLSIPQPSNFPDIEYNTDNNPITEAGFQLGKQLFYDGRLSANNAIPCAFCHEQAFAFTHHGHNLSHGINGNIGLRNSQPIQNLAFQNSFMWDGAASHLDLQPIIPLTSDVEMGETFQNVVAKLQQDANYRLQFSRVFGTDISTETILKALSQFMLMMVSADSKYDKYVRQEDGVTLTPIELDGLETFSNKCASCHATDIFTDHSFRNTGLPIHPNLNDEGRYKVTQNPAEKYAFKVPSLRNVAVTQPYMHDGRFTTLEAVLNFYDSGMVDTGTVDASLQRSDGSFGIPLSDYEKQSLIAFLNTLTDNSFLNDTRFSEF